VTSWPWWFVESFDFKNVQVSLASEREINVTGGGAMQRLIFATLASGRSAKLRGQSEGNFERYWGEGGSPPTIQKEIKFLSSFVSQIS